MACIFSLNRETWLIQCPTFTFANDTCRLTHCLLNHLWLQTLNSDLVCRARKPKNERDIGLAVEEAPLRHSATDWALLTCPPHVLKYSIRKRNNGRPYLSKQCTSADCQSPQDFLLAPRFFIYLTYWLPSRDLGTVMKQPWKGQLSFCQFFYQPWVWSLVQLRVWTTLVLLGCEVCFQMADMPIFPPCYQTLLADAPFQQCRNMLMHVQL